MDTSKQSEKAVASIMILVKNRSESAGKVNEIISQFSDVIVGRLGLPYSGRELNIITLVVDATTDEIGALTGKLGQIKDVKVKSAIAKF